MKLTASILIFVSCIVSGCGGSNPQYVSNDQIIKPPPTTAGIVSINGTRNNFNVRRTQENVLVFDKNNQVPPYELGTPSLLFFNDAHINLNISTQAQKLNTAQIQNLIELYIAFFNRVPDGDGLGYWMTQLSSGRSIELIVDDFYDAGIQASTYTGYSKEMSNADFIKIIYKNVLGRTGPTEPTLSEINYWANEVQSGKQTKSNVIISMLNSARTFAHDPQYAWVTHLLDNKIAVGRYFAIQQGLSYASMEENISRGMIILNAVSANDTSEAIKLIGVDDPNFDAGITAPEVPQNVYAVAKNSSIIFSFDPPTNNGGGEITAYLLTCTDESSSLAVSGIRSPIIIPNLQIGKAYTCFMKSSNRYGASINSTPKSIVVEI